jgi:DNA-binding response OmpR family regulator
MAACLKIVVVEDHDDLRVLTCTNLQKRGHAVTALTCAEELEDSALSGVDVFLLDLNLPGEDGISLSRRIRHAQPDVGIIMLTARTRSSDAVSGYENGADVYLKKPVPFEELCAAIERFARKKGNTPATFTLNGRLLSGPLAQVRLSSSDADALTSFSRAPNGQLEFWQISEVLQMGSGDISKQNIAVRMDRLRKKIVDAGFVGVPIESVRQLGYRICLEVLIA